MTASKTASHSRTYPLSCDRERRSILFGEKARTGPQTCSASANTLSMGVPCRDSHKAKGIIAFTCGLLDSPHPPNHVSPRVPPLPPQKGFVDFLSRSPYSRNPSGWDEHDYGAGDKRARALHTLSKAVSMGGGGVPHLLYLGGSSGRLWTSEKADGLLLKVRKP